MKFFKFFVGMCVYGLTIGVVIAAFGFWYVSTEFAKPGPTKNDNFYTIERGSGLKQIAQGLQQSGYISNEWVFRLGVIALKQQSKLKAGEYQIRQNMSAREIADMIAAGDVYERRITIPEGKTSYEIVQMLNTRTDLSGEIMIIPPEGALLPGTYDLTYNQPRAEVLGLMQKKMTYEMFAQCGYLLDMLDWDSIYQMPFDQLSSSSCPEDPGQITANGLPSTKLQVLTLASIVEKETGKTDERKRIAGVFINRLRLGMPLQSDPTAIYAINQGRHENEGQGPIGRRLLSKDLEIDSPYNTYKYRGLPPGPICNPGSASIAAVLEPEENDYLYFVADGTGGHAFAKTLEEHNQNVANWRKIRDTQ